jgi:hypothetical protein
MSSVYSTNFATNFPKLALDNVMQVCYTGGRKYGKHWTTGASMSEQVMVGRRAAIERLHEIIELAEAVCGDIAEVAEVSERDLGLIHDGLHLDLSMTYKATLEIERLANVLIKRFQKSIGP